MFKKKYRLGNPFSFIVSMFFGALFIYMTSDRLFFVKDAIETTGEVITIEIEHLEHGYRGLRVPRGPYTKFTAVVQYNANDQYKYEITVSAGEIGGQHTSNPGGARFKKGERLRVLYNPKLPFEGYHNSFRGLWFYHSIVFLFFMFFLIVGIFGKKGSKSRVY
jgi:hypothetical protein